jgi:hypothetical protein
MSGVEKQIREQLTSKIDAYKNLHIKFNTVLAAQKEAFAAKKDQVVSQAQNQKSQALQKVEDPQAQAEKAVASRAPASAVKSVAAVKSLGSLF